MMDGDGKSRLDRRTLYAGLLLEWSSASNTYRRFLQKETSQALQAALSLATQPAWRKSFPRPSGIRLYNEDDDDDKAVRTGCTLAMQETIAVALVSCCCCWLVSWLVSYLSLLCVVGRAHCL